MESWVIVGSGGFVEGSVLPYFPKGLIKGVINKNPVRSFGLSKAYDLKQYADHHDAKQDGCTHAYICSANWTHLEWVHHCLEAGLEVVCEKPIICLAEQLTLFTSLAKKQWYGAMIKRVHNALPSVLASKKFIIRATDVGSLDYLDARRGGFLFTELIHYIDIALVHVGKKYSYTVSGTRVRGSIVFKGSTTITIDYDFDSGQRQSPLPFYPELITNIAKKDTRVLVPAHELIPLYTVLLDIALRQTQEIIE